MPRSKSTRYHYLTYIWNYDLAWELFLHYFCHIVFHIRDMKNSPTRISTCINSFCPISSNISNYINSELLGISPFSIRLYVLSIIILIIILIIINSVCHMSIWKSYTMYSFCGGGSTELYLYCVDTEVPNLCYYSR